MRIFHKTRSTKYYELWFYYYGEEDERTDFTREFTFYMKMDRNITSREDALQVLFKKMYINPDKIESSEYRYWLDGHLNDLSNWFEISADEFTIGSGIPA